MKRRIALKKLASSAVGLAMAGKLSANPFEDEQYYSLKGNINHSVCQWTYDFLSLEELCIQAKKMGLKAIDLIAPKDWPVLQKHELYCSMCYTAAAKQSLTEGWNNPVFHPGLIKDFTEAIPLVAAAGYKNLICFSGNRKGMDDETGMKNCVAGLKK